VTPGRVVVVVEEASQQPQQVPLNEHDRMVEQVTADRADEPLDEMSLPQRPGAMTTSSMPTPAAGNCRVNGGEPGIRASPRAGGPSYRPSARPRPSDALEGRIRVTVKRFNRETVDHRPHGRVDIGDASHFARYSSQVGFARVSTRLLQVRNCYARYLGRRPLSISSYKSTT